MIRSEILEIPLADIDVVDRLRPTNPVEVESIAKSIGEIGLIAPIEVMRPTKAVSGYRLVDGAHRLAAHRLLNRTTIQAVLFEGTIEEAVLHEIDANLYRADLTALDQTLFVWKRLEFFEFNKGKLRRGGDRRSNRQHGGLIGREAKTFYEEVSERFGIKRRTAERLVQRGRKIPVDLLDKIRGTKVAENAGLLDKIADIEGKQPGAIREFMGVHSCSIQHAVRLIEDPKKIDPQANRLRQFNAIVSRSSLAELAEFQRLIKDRIKEMKL